LRKLSGYRPTKLADCLEYKLGIDYGKGHERTGWYILQGKKILRVTVPKGHSGEVSPKIINKVIGSLRLNREEFRLLYNCPWTSSDYEKKIRNLIAQNML